MTRKEIYLHIGFPKTGTTTMHECVSLNIKGVKCFIPNASYDFLCSLNDKEAFDDNYKIKQLVENFIFENYDVIEPLNVLRAVKENKIFISTTGPLSALFFQGRYVNKGEYLTPELVASRISDVFSKEFDVKVIISIRRQSDWIPSAFAEWHHYYSKINDLNTLVKFVSCFKDSEHNFAQGLNYLNIVTPFERIFGKSNIYIAVFEHLRQNPADYYCSLIDFMGGEIDKTLLSNVPKRNVRETAGDYKKINTLTIYELLYFFKLRKFPNLSLDLLRRFPFLVKMLDRIKLPSEDKSESIKMTLHDKQEILKLYQEENKNLSHRYGLCLDEYGYF